MLHKSGFKPAIKSRFSRCQSPFLMAAINENVRAIFQSSSNSAGGSDELDGQQCVQVFQDMASQGMKHILSYPCPLLPTTALFSTTSSSHTPSSHNSTNSQFSPSPSENADAGGSSYANSMTNPSMSPALHTLVSPVAQTSPPSSNSPFSLSGSTSPRQHISSLTLTPQETVSVAPPITVALPVAPYVFLERYTTVLLQTLCVLELESRLSHAATLGDGDVNTNFRKSHIITDTATSVNANASHSVDVAEYGKSMVSGHTKSFYQRYLSHKASGTDPVHVGFPLYTHLNDSVRSNNISIVPTSSAIADQKCAKIITRLPLGWQHHLLNLQRDYQHTMLAVAEQAVGSMQTSLNLMRSAIKLGRNLTLHEMCARLTPLLHEYGILTTRLHQHYFPEHAFSATSSTLPERVDENFALRALFRAVCRPNNRSSVIRSTQFTTPQNTIRKRTIDIDTNTISVTSNFDQPHSPSLVNRILPETYLFRPASMLHSCRTVQLVIPDLVTSVLEAHALPLLGDKIKRHYKKRISKQQQALLNANVTALNAAAAHTSSTAPLTDTTMSSAIPLAVKAKRMKKSATTALPIPEVCTVSVTMLDDLARAAASIMSRLPAIATTNNNPNTVSTISCNANMIPTTSTVKTVVKPASASSIGPKRISPAVASILKAWLFDHFEMPYPDDAAKEVMSTKTGLSVQQINYWFANARMRIWRPIVSARLSSAAIASPPPPELVNATHSVQDSMNSESNQAADLDNEVVHFTTDIVSSIEFLQPRHPAELNSNHLESIVLTDMEIESTMPFVDNMNMGTGIMNPASTVSDITTKSSMLC